MDACGGSRSDESTGPASQRLGECPMTRPRPDVSRAREATMVALLCIAYGVVNVDLLGINFLIPFIKPALSLTNGQVGLLIAGYWASFAAGSWLGGRQIDRARSPKRLLVALLVIFALTSPLSGFTADFGWLLAARVLVGAVDGPIAALVQSLIAMESADSRRGLNVAIVQSLGSSILGASVGPLLLVYLARTHGWRYGFFVAPVPALVCAALVFYLLSDLERRSCIAYRARKAGEVMEMNSTLSVILSRNVIWCAAGGAFLAGFMWITMGFLPLLWVDTRHISAESMSFIMAVLGVSAMVLCIGLPVISDRVGRKPVLVLASILGLLLPVVALDVRASTLVLAVLLAVTWTPVGLSSLFMATVPAESVAPESIATAVGFATAFGTFAGGVIAPPLAGWSADHWGQRAPSGPPSPRS